MVVRLDGMVEKVLETLVREGYYKTKTEAVRAGILELGKEYALVGRRIEKMEAEIRSGKRRTFSIEQVAKEAGVEI